MDVPVGPAVSAPSSRFLLAIVLGAFAGFTTAFLVTSCLLSVYTSELFAVYFGLMLLCIGAALIVRVAAQKSNPQGRLLMSLGCIVIISGFLCLALRPAWLESALVRVLYSTLLGMSSSFVLTFGLVDILTVMHDFYTADEKSALVETTRQVNLILFACIVLGITCGVVWGAIDVKYASQLRLDWAIVLPLGTLLGGAASFTNESLRARDIERRYVKIKQVGGNEVDDGI